jgi:FAD synthase
VSDSQKVELLSKAGVSRVVVLPFDDELSALDHAEFSKIVLAQGLSAGVVLVGEDFRYGHGGKGTIQIRCGRKACTGDFVSKWSLTSVRKRASAFPPP